MPQREVTCPYCDARAQFEKGDDIEFLQMAHQNQNKRILASYFWVCHPCEALVGVHRRSIRRGEDGTRPLGPLAKKDLRRKRLQLHKAADPLWRVYNWSRERTYKWLADRMGIALDDCHIAWFTEEQCDKALQLLEELVTFLRKNKPADKTRSKT